MMALLPRSFVVEERIVETSDHDVADAVTLTVRPAAGPLPAYLPGQFAMLSVFGNAEVPISVSRVGEGRQLHTIRAVGAATKALAALAPGAHIGVRGPYGSVWPIEAARGRDVLLAAGGLGMAPLRPVVDHIVAHRAAFGSVTLLVGAREAAQLLYPAELKAWAAAIDVLVTVDHDVRVRGAAPWTGHVGLITKLIPKARFDPSTVVAFVCGPEVMMRFCAQDLAAAGVAASRIYLSLERNMKCAVGLCGHCQFGATFICRDGPVLPYDGLAKRLLQREL